MPRPKSGRYYLIGVDHREGKEDEQVPSVTTVLRQWGDKGGMVHAAWKLGMEGESYREIWAAKASVGTAVHEMIPIWLSGGTPETAETYLKLDALDQEKAWRAFQAFRDWIEQSKLEPITCEQPMVSREHRFGGTPDALFRKPSGELVIGDYKSGRYYATETAMQLGAYRTLIRENMEEPEPIYEGVVLRFDAETGDFSQMQRGAKAMEDGWAAFYHLLQTYRITKEME